jgi:hypothetical protein
VRLDLAPYLLADADRNADEDETHYQEEPEVYNQIDFSTVLDIFEAP